MSRLWLCVLVAAKESTYLHYETSRQTIIMYLFLCECSFHILMEHEIEEIGFMFASRNSRKRSDSPKYASDTRDEKRVKTETSSISS